MEFDAYHKWLGIPPSQQPPNHYRLLGVDVFEADLDVIDAAANQRISYLQDLAAGEHLAASQKLLNEVSQARRCLLNSEKKFLYDLELRKRLEPASPVPKKPASGLPPRTVAILGVGAVIGLLIVLWLAFSGGNNAAGDTATLVIDWPLNQREAAQVLIQGKPYSLPAEPIARLTVPAGRYDMVLRRAGFADIRIGLTVVPGDKQQFRPAWRPSRN